MNLRTFAARAGVVVGAVMLAPVSSAQVPREAAQYRATVSVFDNRGNPVTGLTAGDFVVTVGDVAREASSADVRLGLILGDEGAKVPAMQRTRPVCVADAQRDRRHLYARQ